MFYTFFGRVNKDAGLSNPPGGSLSFLARVPRQGATGRTSHIVQEDAMARSIDANIHLTPSGARLDLQSFYVYPDGHANLIFGDGTNWPLNDEYQVIQELSRLLRDVQKAAANGQRG